MTVLPQPECSSERASRVPISFVHLWRRVTEHQRSPKLHAMRTRTTFLLLMLSCWFAQPLVAAEPLHVSLVQLIANPMEYDGKAVLVVGFVRLEFEGNAIYLHQDDYKHRITKNGLWIDVSNDIRKSQNDYDQKYVLLAGTFNAKQTGHMELWSGSIQKITRAKVWSEKGGGR